MAPIIFEEFIIFRILIVLELIKLLYIDTLL